VRKILMVLTFAGAVFSGWHSVNLTKVNIVTKPRATARPAVAPTPRPQIELPSRAKKLAGTTAAPAERTSHPRAPYENPGAIRSFADPALAEAFNIYFSLVGPEKEKYPFAKSGFDTDRNTALAIATLKNTDYRKLGKNPQKTFEAALLAATHLAYAQTPSANEARRDAAEYLVRTIEREGSSVAAKLHKADLLYLVENFPREQMPEVARIYRETTDKSVQRSLAVGIETALRKRGFSEAEQKSYFLTEKIDRPQIKEPL
jgi:hypothetical protein